MTLLVTGGNGFVMSNLVEAWLARDAGAKVVVLDNAPADAPMQRILAGGGDRAVFLQADITRPETWRDALDSQAITQVVHGATMTLFARVPGDDAAEAERAMPARVLEVNIMGTVNLLDWARTVRRADGRPLRFLNLSSGAVYGDDGPDTPGDPLPEDGWIDPPEFYGIGKLATEQIAARYGQLFPMETASVRLSYVYGPMDRHTPSRVHDSAMQSACRLALRGEVARIVSPDVIADWIYVRDVARGLMALLDTASLEHKAYNCSYGAPTALGTVLDLVGQLRPGFRWEVVPLDQANAVMMGDPEMTAGRWGAYDNSRLRAAGWSPRPLRDGIADYLDWLARETTPPR
ncbi:MAG: NAD(P)-dependent oxidoreductase [Alphaproteobacteria bacterium]